MDSLKIAKPNNVFLSSIFPCMSEYRETFYDLFASRIERAVKLDHKNPLNLPKIDEALKAASGMASKGEVQQYLDDLFTNEFIGGAKYHFLCERLDKLNDSSPPSVTALKTRRPRVFFDF